ncbi:hypothetical protein D3C78_502870 [compost metagenome]
MKITDWSIIFVLIAAPLLWIGSLRSEQLREINRLEIQYTSLLRTAALDGGMALNLNELQYYESGYASSKFMRTNKELGLESMLNTLAINFGIQDDPVAKMAMMRYIPVILVIDYDGYYLYVMNETTAQDGSIVYEHCWLPKKPFLYEDSHGNSLSFTLDHYITVIDSFSGAEKRGTAEEIASGPASTLVAAMPFLQDKNAFEEVRRSTIVRCVGDDLEAAVRRHNLYTTNQDNNQGNSYVFTLPFMSQEDWNNTIDDIGMLVFLQGLPVGDKYFNNYALGVGRLVKSQPIVGSRNPENGIKYQSRSGSDFLFPAEEVFSNKSEAAGKGYFEWNERH